MVAMDLEKALQDGPAHVRNAEEQKGRKIPSPDFLYMWDNQVHAIDNFLADSELLASDSEPLRGMRAQLRDIKKELEKQIIAFEAQVDGEEVPTDEPPEDDLATELKAFGADLLKDAQKAAKKKVEDVKKLSAWEEPVGMVNSFLADSEPLAAKDEELAKLREELRALKRQLDEGIARVFAEWRAADIAGGEAGGEDEEG